MWQLFIFTILFLFMITVFTIRRYHMEKLELDDYNALYECSHCKKLYRRY